MPSKHSPQTNRPWRHWYKSKTWKALRLATFKRDMFKCRICGEPTHLTRDKADKRAATCDHIIPHNGDKTLFFDASNLQTLCKGCHDGTKQSQERTGYSREIGKDGWPVDPMHPFNKG